MMKKNIVYEPPFEEFWRAYPRDAAKQYAFERWEKAVQRIAAELEAESRAEVIAWLLERTKAYAASVKGKKAKFIPHASTWLNKSRYYDDLEKPSRPEGLARPSAVTDADLENWRP
jgi:hypothetical protein